MSGKTPKPDPRDDRDDQLLDVPWWLRQEAEASVRMSHDEEGTQVLAEGPQE